MRASPKSQVEYTLEPAFINRQQEMRFLASWIAERPMNLLFIFGPKSSGKTTLLYRFIKENLSNTAYEIKHFNLREILITRYHDFIRAFFEHDYSKKTDIRERREYDLKVFKLSVEVLKGLDANELDPFVVMKRELEKLNARNVRPIIIIDELQALEGIYINGQRELLKELFNFFVAMTKESHLCHVLIASSDGYFIERIYNDSKLKKTSRFMEVAYLSQKDVNGWLSNLERESAIKGYTLTPEQIERAWQTFGGSCWEISRFLGDILMRAEGGKVPDEAFDDELRKVHIQMRSLFVDYGYTKKRQAIFLALHQAVSAAHAFPAHAVQRHLPEGLLDEELLRQELAELVRQNFLAYNPVTAEFSLQGRSMEIGLKKFIESLDNRES